MESSANCVVVAGKRSGETRYAACLVLATTRAAVPYAEYSFQAEDNLVLGRESAGVPDEVHEAADTRLVIPLKPGLRSLNVAQAAAMVLGEALRQTALFPKMDGISGGTLCT